MTKTPVTLTTFAEGLMITSTTHVPQHISQHIGALAATYLDDVVFGATLHTHSHMSDVVLDDHAMLLLAEIAELVTQRSQTQSETQHASLTQEINRLRRSLIDVLVHLVQFPSDDTLPRTLARHMPLPAYIHSVVQQMSTYRGETLTVTEMAVAVQLYKVYVGWEGK